MKMAGIEYDERIEELEKLEYPKPNREFIYSTFNAFADKHPWVGQENIRPKSIAREMFESFRSFSDYIRDYELQRAEGVLLRYVNRVFKVLSQTVPDAAKNDAVREMEKQLKADEAWVLKPKSTTTEAAPPDNTELADLAGRARIVFKLARLALQSDSTRVVTVFLRGMDLRPPIPGVSEDHHGCSHHGRNPAKIEQLKLIEQALMAAFREFLGGLRDANLLDSTQVLIGSNLGDASGHGTSNLPILLAGGGHKHGQHIAGDPKNNTPLGELFVSMLQRFGVETDTFGSGTGTIDGL
jgi:hypothetical protein